MPPPNEEFVLDLLRDMGLVTRKQIEEARTNLDGSASLVDLLVRQDLVSADDISRTVAAQAQIDWVDLADMVVPQEVIDEIKPQDARRFKMIPIARNENGLVVATGDPLDFDSIDSLSFLLKREIELVCSTPEKIRQSLIKYYGSAEEAVDVLREKIGMPRSEELESPRAPNCPRAKATMRRSSGWSRCSCSKRTSLARATSISNRLRKVSASASGLTACSRKCNRRRRNCSRPSSAGSRS
jgi:hypothetical protein